MTAKPSGHDFERPESPPLGPDPQAVRVAIRGVVQGVGFRPFVYRLAIEHRVCGWVLNGEAGVEIHAEAKAAEIDLFLAALRGNAPVAARVSEFDVRPSKPEQFIDFQIRDSRFATSPTVRISADLAICGDCLRELNDPADRRFEYPYINCTNCGPRYSIVRQLPYDRANTTMAAWPMCADCRREYENPADRRYHAQPVACPKCGPNYRLQFAKEPVGEIADFAIRRAAELLREGRIVAIKGIGGYHLACDAQNRATIELLRTRKFRKEQPFALMIKSIEEARALAALSTAHEALLQAVARPIVLARAQMDLPGIAPDNASLGIMLPYAPLHHLLFKFGAPSRLVLTSANHSSEPIAYRDDDARARLNGIADALLIGEREIARRVDDSVVAVRRGKPLVFRRSRGYAPATVCRIPTNEPILALGGDLKNTIALVVQGGVLISQHIGDLSDYQAELALTETVRDLLAMYELKPEVLTVVHDLHPQFTSTRIAQALPARRHVAVQHHQAHIASVMAEHELLDEPVIGVAFDGTGYGTDGSIWGGEFFVGSVRDGLERVAWLRPVRMPGGDGAARFPVQAAAGFLAEVAKQDELPDMAGPPWNFPPRFREALAMIAKDVRCFQSTSVGRLFDAVAALLGFTRESTFEGQAAIWLEQLAARTRQGRAMHPAYLFQDLDHRPLLRAILADRMAGRDVSEISFAFHAALAGGVVEQVRALSNQRQIITVALSGGVFQNELLLNMVLLDLEQIEPALRVLTNENVPPGDGGTCLGQAALAVMQK
jgi:hydrogenase maturation protein HypF